jgi:hypothetical protein
MGNRRKIRRFRLIFNSVLIIPILIFSQAEYQIQSVPNNVASLAFHNGFDALKKHNCYYVNTYAMNDSNKSISLVRFPAGINLLNYTNNYSQNNNNLIHYSLSFIDYGTFQNKIDDQIIDEFTSYELMANYFFTKSITRLWYVEYTLGGLYSQIDTYNSSLISSNIKFYSQINNYNISFSINNIGIILKSYTSNSIKTPLKGQFSIIKINKNKKIILGYDIVYHFNFNNIQHIIGLYTNINENVNIMVSTSSYRKYLRVDNLNNDLLYGLGLGINIITKHKSKIDLGISSLGSAGHIFGLTFNF